MKPKAMLQELESAAETISVKVTYESMAAAIGRGGLCRVKGEYRVIIDKRASVQERVTTLARSLARKDLLERMTGAEVKLSKAVREMVQYYARPRRVRPQA